MRLRPPDSFFLACRRAGVSPTRHLLTISVPAQRMAWFERGAPPCHGVDGPSSYRYRRSFVVSTSRFGVGQQAGSNRTPLGLHRVAEKIGGGWPIGTVFRSRVPVGFTWKGMASASIVHRILWLDGLEVGVNRGGRVDTHARYVYIHGYGDELTLGRPQSCGCIHVSAADLMPLYECLPTGTLVWIADTWA